MFIKEITIETVDGLDVVIIRNEGGAIVRQMNRASRAHSTVLCEVRCDESREARFAKAYEVARVICGESRDRRTGKMVPNATNSMIHDVLQEIERVAGC
jgi:hypothetical protein